VPILSIIPEDLELNKASASGNSILVKNPDSNTSRIIMNLAAVIIGKYDYDNDLTSEGIITKFFHTVFGKYLHVYRS